MFKTEIVTKNFRDETIKETLRFNLSETELLDLAKLDKTFSQEYLEWIVGKQDVSAMFDVIRKIIAVSYGVMSEDGKYFRKKEDDIYDFLHSAVYDEFIDKLINDENLISEFIIGVFPAKFSDKIREGMKNRPALDVVG